MKINHFRTEFVEYVPGPREEGVLYISTRFKTAIHSCACGCGNKVVTPLAPASWKITWNGDDTTLSPSIGSWGFPCKSHYLIADGHVRWAPLWNQSQIAAGRARDRKDREKYFNQKNDNDTGIAIEHPAKSVTSRIRALIYRLVVRER